MTKNKSFIKSLSLAKIDSSPEIRDWLSQFPAESQPLAKLLLSHLKFISRDDYSRWVIQTILSFLDKESTFALYSVRKLNIQKTSPYYWGENKEAIYRPGTSQGSEDLVYSLISNLVRQNSKFLLDHPSLDELKDKKVRNYILIDDSIGSGDRVSEFINSMLKHPTFFSWWNFGWINIHIVSFSRFHEAEKKIIMNIRGKDNAKQKIRKSSKIKFHSELVYYQNWIKSRWGENYEQLIELCKNQTQILPWARLGYRKVFSDIIFYHSVPNNTPGIIWFEAPNWKPLMPQRSVPTWLVNLLEMNDKINISAPISDELLNILRLIKRGIKKPSSISQRLAVDVKYANNLLSHIKNMGFTDENTRLTHRGLEFLHKKRNINLPSWDNSMYIPKSWCAG
ncbi:MAG: hypothetical protein KH843_07110 [Haemophilus haemolyticus]|nr:hypothetical protein [Haemophilus haemolyticus]